MTQPYPIRALATINIVVISYLQSEKTRRDELSKEKDKLQGQVAELGGLLKSQERLLELEKVCSWLISCLKGSTSTLSSAQ